MYNVHVQIHCTIIVVLLYQNVFVLMRDEKEGVMYMLAVSLVSPAPQQSCPDPGLSVCLEPLEYPPLLYSGETHPLSGGDTECCTNNSQTCSNTEHV